VNLARLSGVAAVSALGLALGLIQASPTSAEPGIDVAPAFTPALTPVDCPVPKPEQTPPPPGTTCFALTVPLDWQTPDDGRTVDIAVMVTRAKRKPGTNGLTWNPGGPGGEALGDHGGLYAGFPASIVKRFDLVSWDPRGVGLSEPKLAGCSQQDVAPVATGPVDWGAYWQEYSDVVGAANAACFEANPDAAPYLGTWQVVRDMDALREALGYRKWNYWGMSYGTRLGNNYARTFPDKLRAFIQDGSLMANETLARFGATSPGGEYLANQVYASNVGKNQAWKMSRVLEFLDDTVIPLGGDTYTRWDAQSAVNEAQRTQDYSKISTLVNQAYAYVRAYGAGDEERAARSARRIKAAVTPDPKSDSFVINMVTCADLRDRPTVGQLAAMSEQAERNYGTALGVETGRAALCLGLPSGYSPPSYSGNDTVRLAAPPLFLLTTGDAATPWAWGRSLANTYSGARVMTFDSTMHVSGFRTPSSCMKDVTERYLLTLTLPRKDGFCAFIPYPN